MTDSPLNILLIEDDETDRLFIANALKTSHLDVQIIECSDLASGEKELEAHSPDCIILDNLLPGGKGITLLDKIRSQGKLTPIIIISSAGDELFAVDAMKKGASDYVPKDMISPESLTRSINNALHTYKLEMRTKMAELKLVQSEERYRTIVETISDFIFELDPDRKIRFINSAFKFLGYASSDLVGKPIEDLLDSDDLESDLPLVATNGVGPLATANLKIRLKTNPESTIWEEMKTMNVILDAAGLWDVPIELVFKKDYPKIFLGTVCIARKL